MRCMGSYDVWVGCCPCPALLLLRTVWACGCVLRDQSVFMQQLRSMATISREGLELFLFQWYDVGQQHINKAFTLAEPVRPFLALLFFLLLDQPLAFVFKLTDFPLKRIEFIFFVFFAYRGITKCKGCPQTR